MKLIDHNEVLQMLGIDASKYGHPRNLVMRLYRKRMIEGVRIGSLTQFSEESVRRLIDNPQLYRKPVQRKKRRRIDGGEE